MIRSGHSTLKTKVPVSILTDRLMMKLTYSCPSKAFCNKLFVYLFLVKMPRTDIPPLTKRYYVTNDYENNLYPQAFVSSPRKKYVHVVGATVMYSVSNGSYYMPKNICIHADFVLYALPM